MSKSRVKNLVAERLAAHKARMLGTTIPEVDPVADTSAVDVCITETVTQNTYYNLFGNPRNGLPDFDVKVFSKEDWTEDAQFFIPKKLDSFVVDHRVLYPLVLGIEKNLKVLVYGPTGCGKTTMVEYVAAVKNQPYLRINGRGDLESETLLGRPWITDGSMEWNDGSLPIAVAGGWMVAFDEPFKVPSHIQMALQRYYENGGILQLDDKPGTLKDKQVIAHADHRMVLCDNVVGTGDSSSKYGATLIQDSSTINRMDLVLRQEYLSPADEAKMIAKKYPSVDDKVVKRVIQLVNLLRQGFDNEELAVAVSARNIDSWLTLYLATGSLEYGFKASLLGRYADSSESESVENHYFTVFNVRLQSSM